MECSIVLIIDCSDSMAVSGDLERAKTVAATFVNVMDLGDNLGILAFDDDTYVMFGTENSLTALTASTLASAMTAITQVWSDDGMTDMVKAFTTAYPMMANSSAPMGMVFLSDGMYNRGGNPVDSISASPPIFTVALGDNGQEETLQQIATASGGAYHMADTAEELAEIYFAIADQSSVASLVNCLRHKVEQFKFTSVDGIISTGATQATFAVWWENVEVAYTANTPAGPQVKVYVTDPDGKTVTAPAIASGDGFVVLKVSDPAAGTYKVHTWFTGKGTLKYTAGLFDNDTDLVLELTAPRQPVTPGSPAGVEVRLTDAGEPIDGAELIATIESPLVALDEALAAHAERLEGIAIPDDVAPEHVAAARLAVLRRELGTNLLPRQERPVAASSAGDGRYRIHVPPLETSGSHTVRVNARGVSPRSGAAFQRSSRISLIVA